MGNWCIILIIQDKSEKAKDGFHQDSWTYKMKQKIRHKQSQIIQVSQIALVISLDNNNGKVD